MLQSDEVLGHFCDRNEKGVFFVCSLRKFTPHDVFLKAKGGGVTVESRLSIPVLSSSEVCLTPISTGGKDVESRISINWGIKPHACWTVRCQSIIVLCK